METEDIHITETELEGLKSELFAEKHSKTIENYESFISLN